MVTFQIITQHLVVHLRFQPDVFYEQTCFFIGELTIHVLGNRLETRESVFTEHPRLLDASVKC